MLFSSKSRLSKLVRKVEKRSKIADKAENKIGPYNKEILDLKEEIERNESHYGKYGKPAHAKLCEKLRSATNNRSIMTARYEVSHKKHWEAFSELEDYTKSLIDDIPAEFYDKAKITVYDIKNNYINVIIGSNKLRKEGSYSINIKREKVTCFKKFIAPTT